jgi:hypothetical protein
MTSIDDLFKGRHFDREIIIPGVRWCLWFKLSFRDLVVDSVRCRLQSLWLRMRRRLLSPRKK